MDINQALRCFIGGAVPSGEALRTEACGVAPHVLEAWVAEFKMLIRDLEQYLHAGQVSDWKLETQQAVVCYARAAHPWIDAESSRALLCFVGWYGFQEGFIQLGC